MGKITIRRVGFKDPATRKMSGRRRQLHEATALRSATSSCTSRNDLSPTLKIVQRETDVLKPASRRVRKDNAAQLERMVRIIQTVGICAPILIDGKGRVIDGHVILDAAKELGLRTVPCIPIEHLDESEIEYLKLSLNRLGECAEWDIDSLRPIVVDLQEKGFRLTDVGFSIAEQDIIIQSESLVLGQGADGPEELPPQPVSKLGDLWRLGDHWLLCADSTDPSSYARLLDGDLADAIFTDPPWNIPIEGFVSGLGKTKHKNFKMATGELSDAEFIGFIDKFMQPCEDHMAGGAVLFCCIDWRSDSHIISAAKKAGLRHINTAVWSKGSGGMGGLYRSAHELVIVLCKGHTPKINNVALGKHGRDRTNVWTYPGANKLGSSASKALAHHPTPKPIELVHDALLDVTKMGDLVLDPFMGSGTTLLAAEQSKRRARGIELDPAYVDVCITRWEEITGKRAIHADSELSFDEMRQRRAKEAEEATTDNE